MSISSDSRRLAGVRGAFGACLVLHGRAGILECEDRDLAEDHLFGELLGPDGERLAGQVAAATTAVVASAGGSYQAEPGG
ncbi:MAG: hypothetical protein WKF73_08760 [Nocardioidaceae bacterium]